MYPETISPAEVKRLSRRLPSGPWFIEISPYHIYKIREESRSYTIAWLPSGQKPISLTSDGPLPTLQDAYARISAHYDEPDRFLPPNHEQTQTDSPELPLTLYVPLRGPASIWVHSSDPSTGIDRPPDAQAPYEDLISLQKERGLTLDQACLIKAKKRKR